MFPHFNAIHFLKKNAEPFWCIFWLIYLLIVLFCTFYFIYNFFFLQISENRFLLYLLPGPPAGAFEWNKVLFHSAFGCCFHWPFHYVNLPKKYLHDAMHGIMGLHKPGTVPTLDATILNKNKFSIENEWIVFKEALWKHYSFSQSLWYISQIRIEICKAVSALLKTMRSNSKTPWITCKSQSLAQNP